MSIRNRAAFAAAAIGLALAAAGAKASTVEINQTGQLHSGSYIDDFYIGGYAGNSYTSGPLNGNSQYGPGLNLGFTFSSNAVVQSSGSSAGKFENLPTNDADHNTQILSFSSLGGSTTTDTINFAQGFSTVSFDYASAAGLTADVWSGLNGTGTLVGTISLLANAASGAGCAVHTDAYCTWNAAAYSGATGESITFGTANSTPSVSTELYGVTVAPVPLPAAGWLLLSGMGAFAGMARRRRLAA